MSEALVKPEKLDAQMLLNSFQEAWHIVQKKQPIDYAHATDEVFVLDALYDGLGEEPLYERLEDIPEVQYEELAKKSLNAYILSSKSSKLDDELREIKRRIFRVYVLEKVIIRPVNEQEGLTVGNLHEIFGFIDDKQPRPKEVKGRIHSVEPAENCIAVVSNKSFLKLKLHNIAVLDSTNGQPLVQIEFPKK